MEIELEILNSLRKEKDTVRQYNQNDYHEGYIKGMTNAIAIVRDLYVEERKSTIEIKLRKSYLERFVNPDASYDVSYTIKPNGEKVYCVKTLKGADLTENQIVELFKSEQL